MKRVAVGLAITASLVATSAVAAEWTPFGEDSGAVCADGSQAPFFERVADPTKVALYFEGGGACWSAETCAFDSPDKTYTSSSPATPEWLSERAGLFDFENPENPLADHSFVYVPYCTGDLHLGETTRTYGDDITVEHRGAANAQVALDHLTDSFPGASELVVTGISAGSVPTPLYAARLADAFPEARIVTLGDGSGGYPDDPVVNGLLGSLWGALSAVPDWPEVAGLGVREWSAPGLYVHGGQHAPEVTFARFDFAFDEAQTGYVALLGMGDEDLVSLMDRNEADIEAQGVPVVSYTAPGAEHTLLWRDDIYELEVEGVRLIDWIGELVEGGIPTDVHCVDCH